MRGREKVIKEGSRKERRRVEGIQRRGDDATERVGWRSTDEGPYSDSGNEWHAANVERRWLGGGLPKT